MPDPARKWQENAPGPYYVDDQCIDCDLCRTLAPDHFARSDEGGYSYLAVQPTGDPADCEAALRECPVEAIGRDGEPG